MLTEQAIVDIKADADCKSALRRFQACRTVMTFPPVIEAGFNRMMTDLNNISESRAHISSV
jgi:hypothetical protein